MLGRRALVKIVKNKVAPPFKRAEFDIMFGEGISQTGELVDLGVEYGIVVKSGAWFSYNGSKLAQGREAAKQVLADNPELFEEIAAKITEAMHSAERTPRAKTARKPAEASEAAPIDTTSGLDLDEDLADDPFSIEEDL